MGEHDKIVRGGGTGEAGEATASPEFRGFTTEKCLASWMYEMGNFSCFTGKKLVPLPLIMKLTLFYKSETYPSLTRALIMI